jgi:hypothetical protein
LNVSLSSLGDQRVFVRSSGEASAFEVEISAALRKGSGIALVRPTAWQSNQSSSFEGCLPN